MKTMLKWFTGKSLENATLALDMLQASIDNGSWLPKHSSKVRAALTKANVAQKWAKANRFELETIGLRPVPISHRPPGQSDEQAEKSTYKTPDNRRGWNVAHTLSYCQPVSRLDFVALRDEAKGSPDHLKLLDYAEGFARDFAPAQEAMDKLDATRPRPVFTSLGVSPTLTRTLTDMGIQGTMETVRPCPEKWELEEHIDKKTGRVNYAWVCYLLFPENTVHRASRHAHGGGVHTQCHACGHAIRNNYNWVVLLVDDAKGVPHSIWVGRDCAMSLFGIKVTGEIEIGNATP